MHPLPSLFMTFSSLAGTAFFRSNFFILHICVHQQYRFYETFNLHFISHDYYVLTTNKKFFSFIKFSRLAENLKISRNLFSQLRMFFISFVKLKFEIKDASINFAEFDFAILGKIHQNYFREN